MSNLTSLNLDPNVQEDNGSGGITIIPSGKYKAVIISDDVRDTKNNTGKGIELTLQIVEGEYTDTILKDWLNLRNQNLEAQQIGQGQLKRICRIVGVAFPPPDTSLMYGKPILLTVTVAPYYKDKTKNVNKIKSYNPVPNNFTPVPATPTEPTIAAIDEVW